MVETLGGLRTLQRASAPLRATDNTREPASLASQQHWHASVPGLVCVASTLQPGPAHTDVIFSNGAGVTLAWPVLCAGAGPLPPLAGFLMLADRDLSNGLGAGGDGAQVELLVGEKDDK